MQPLETILAGAPPQLLSLVRSLLTYEVYVLLLLSLSVGLCSPFSPAETNVFLLTPALLIRSMLNWL